MSIRFSSTTAPEQKNGVLLGTLSISGYGAGTFQYYFGEVERFSFVGDKLYLGSNYHYDLETDRLVKYTSDNGATRYHTEIDRIAVKFTETASGNSTWDYISLNFSEVVESISLIPVEFSGYDYGATFAQISSSGVETLAYGLGSNSTLFEISDNYIKLKSTYYFDPLQNRISDAAGTFYSVKDLNDVYINSFQSSEEDINFRDSIELSSAFSAVKKTPTPYFAGAPTEAKSKTRVSTTDALLYDSPEAWASNNTYDNGTSTTITYSFAGTSDLYLFKDGYSTPNPKVDNIYAFSASQKAAVRLALEQFSNVADIIFVEVAETASEVGTLRFGFTDHNYGNSWGWATPPSSTAVGGDIWIASESRSETFIRGADNNFASIMHEIGHALGLKHPFEGANQLPKAQDFANYTLMSYTDPENYYYYDTSGNYNYLISSTPMVYDIAALQHLYGAASHNTGNTVYEYDPSKPFVEAIWDSGGYDTLDLSNFNKACTVNLTPGAYSTIVCTSWSMTDNLGIASGAIIEKVIGGAGNDVITGNSQNNVLDGGRGNDTIYGGAGNDVFDQGSIRAGTDKFYGGDGDDFYFIYSSGQIDEVIEYSNEGTDTVKLDLTSSYILPENVENLTVFKNDSNKVLSGNGLNNVIRAQGGNDTIDGGAGDDTIYCGAGNDTLTGRLGSDEFVFYLGDGANIITDFDLTLDTCTFLDANNNKQTHTESTNSKNEVKYLLSDGTSVTLQGLFAETTYTIPTSGLTINHTGRDATVNAPYNLSLYDEGIFVNNAGTGSTTITATGTIKGGVGQTDQTANSDGIYAWNENTAKNLSITAKDVTGLDDGVFAVNKGTGFLNISFSGDVVSASTDKSDEDYSFGVYASGYGTDVTVSADGDVTSNDAGIYVWNEGSGSTSVTSSGKVTSTSTGIFARNKENSSASDIIIIAKDIDAEWGIAAANHGSAAGISEITVTGVIDAKAWGITTDYTNSKAATITVSENASVLGFSGGIATGEKADTVTIIGAVLGMGGTAIRLGLGNDTVNLGKSALTNGVIDGGTGAYTANFSVAKSAVDSFTFNEASKTAVVTVNSQVTTFKDFEYFKFSDDTSAMTTANAVSTFNKGSPAESTGAIYLVNSGTNSAPVLDFYLDKTKDPGDAGVTSVDVVLKFDPTDSKLYVA
ncbi:M10 family metallopeptidase C-terminal domain-containing protein [Paracoccaceae bacterium]|nr:M10 family metallopeptidase C-terminal domain-containing protein [Paracoccaceae bacterium]